MIQIKGGMCFLIAANYIVEDKANVDDYIKKRNYQKVTDSNEMIVQAPSSGSETSVNNVNESSWVTKMNHLQDKPIRIA